MRAELWALYVEYKKDEKRRNLMLGTLKALVEIDREVPKVGALLGLLDLPTQVHEHEHTVNSSSYEEMQESEITRAYNERKGQLRIV